MKIAYGVNPSFKSIEIVKQYCVTNLYCGYVNSAMSKKWPEAFLCVNRRGEGSNFYGRKDFSVFAKKSSKI